MEKLQALRLVEEAIWHHLTPEGGGGHEEMINFFLMKLNSVKKKKSVTWTSTKHKITSPQIRGGVHPRKGAPVQYSMLHYV